MKTLSAENKEEEWNISNSFLKIAPQWYYDKIEELNDYRLANNYVVWVLNTYEAFIREEVDAGYTVNSTPVKTPSETRRVWFESVLPWVVKEREKTYYMMQSITNRLMHIVIHGVKSPEDLTYLYFYQMIFTDKAKLSMPKFAQDLFVIADNLLVPGKNFTSDTGGDSLLKRSAMYFGLDSLNKAKGGPVQKTIRDVA